MGVPMKVVVLAPKLKKSCRKVKQTMKPALLCCSRWKSPAMMPRKRAFCSRLEK
jgi:hypothetical protein